MSFCHNFFNFVQCGKSSTVQPLITQDTRAISKRKEEETSKLNPSAPLRIPKADSVQCEDDEDRTDGLINNDMVDIRSSSMIRPCLIGSPLNEASIMDTRGPPHHLIGSPPPSVLRERSKFRRDRLTQSRLATVNNSSQPAEETVLHSTGETPAIHLSCSVDDSGPEDDDNMEIVALSPPGTGVSLPERLTPPPRIEILGTSPSNNP